MKKIILLSAIILMLAMPVSAETQVEQEAKVKDEFSFVVGSPEYTCNGETVLFDENAVLAPYISEVTSQFMIPLRAFAENCGFEVLWHDTAPETITIARGYQLIEGEIKYNPKYQQVDSPRGFVQLYTGENSYETIQHWLTENCYKASNSTGIYKGDVLPPVDIYSEICEGNTYIPIREWSSIFGMKVEWFQEERKVEITDLSAEELFERNVDIRVDGNDVTITTREKNNSGVYTYNTYPSPEFVRIITISGEEVHVPKNQGGVGVVTNILIPPGYEQNRNNISVELPKGEYYYEVRFSAVWRVNYFKSLKTDKYTRYYFEVE